MLLPIEVCAFILTNLSPISMFNLSVSSKLFYVLCRLQNVFTFFSGKIQDSLKKFLGADISFLLKKRLLSTVIFNVMPFRAYSHMFFCGRGLNINEWCSSCSRVNITHDLETSILLDKKLQFGRFLLPDDFSDQDQVFFLSIILVWDLNHFDEFFGNFFDLFHEQIDRLFLFYKMYLEVLSSIVFNSMLEEIFPLVLSTFECKKGLEKKYCIFFLKRLLIFLFV